MDRHGKANRHFCNFTNALVILSVGPLLTFEDFMSVVMSPRKVTCPSQSESSGGTTILMPLDLRVFL